jgi:hypothetical protein
VNLKLRNNRITELPVAGLDTHQQLKNLLLENNKIQRLPPQIANIRTLTAINLTDNPIEYPPLNVVRKGCKALQEHMRDDYVKIRDLQQNSMTAAAVGYYEMPLSDEVLNYEDNRDPAANTDDVWDSDNEAAAQAESRARSSLRARSAFSRTPENINYFKKYLKRFLFSKF